MGLRDITVTRFPNGVTNRSEDDLLGGSLRMLDPTRYHTFFEDFDYYVADDWTITGTNAGTPALSDGDGGLLAIVNDTADDDGTFLQKVGESFTVESGKRLFFKARLEVLDAEDSDFIVGLAITDSTPLDASDGIFFRKDDGDQNLDIVSVKNSVAVSSIAATVESGEVFELGFMYDGLGRVYYSFNGTVLGYLEPGASLPDDEVLTITVGIQNGAAAANAMTVDYILAAKER